MATFWTTLRCPKCEHDTKHCLVEVRLIEGESDMGSAVVQCDDAECAHVHKVVGAFDVVVGRRYSR
jgi:hypothetical protein